jgi:hypothetical protein
VEEKLFSGGKHKIIAAVHTLQHLVLEFHGFPFQPQSTTFRKHGSLSRGRAQLPSTAPGIPIRTKPRRKANRIR